MKKAGGMQQATDVATEAAGVDHDKVTIAADDAGAAAAAQKMGKVLQRDGDTDREEPGSAETRLCGLHRPPKRGRS